jgi:hypothetical protein
VPLLSPRETKAALAAATFFSATAMSLPFAAAGSFFGPISTKSLYMTSKRFAAKPSATNLSSAAVSCTKSTSASPRLAMSIACPVPTATTLTSMLLACLKAGSRCANRPDCSVEVVDAMVIVSACAAAPAAARTSAAATNSNAFMPALL